MKKIVQGRGYRHGVESGFFKTDITVENKAKVICDFDIAWE